MKIKQWNWVVIIATTSAVIGLLILIYFLFFNNEIKLIFGNEINLDIATKVGSFIGGLVGSFWTLTGVLLYYSVIRSQKDDSIQATTRHNEQVDLLNLQKFQSSFFELFKLFLSKRNELTNSARRNKGNTKNIYAFDELTGELHQYAGEYNEAWKKGEDYNSEDMFVLEDSYREKMTEFCELLILILHEIYRYPDREKVLIYERMLFNVLTFKQIASIIHCAIFDSDKTSRLRNALFRSELWEIRCLVMLNQFPEISTFWNIYRSKFRCEFP